MAQEYQNPIKVQVEHSMLYAKEFRYVRFDVYASTETKVQYDLEMQNGHKEELPKRARFHQAEMDATFLKPGQGFSDLPESFVIFICTYDPFDSGLYRYTFVERREENGEYLGDGTCKIYLNTKGTNAGDVPPELIHFLQYVENSTETYVDETKDEKIRKLHWKVEELKKSRRLEESYMTLEELVKDLAEERVEEVRAESMAEGKAVGKAEGKAVGAQLTLSLVSLMIRDNLVEEVPRLSEDADFYASMLEKYHLK